MSSEKKYWRLPTPFRGLSRTRYSQAKQTVGESRSRVSSVYLSDDISASGFIVVPEFDDPVQIQTPQEPSNQSTSPPPKLPAVASSGPLSPKGYNDLESIGSCHDSSSLGRGSESYNTSVADASWDDDLSQRLGSAYEHIRSMSSVASPKVSLSSDPHILRKQLGVPQHSVLNYPTHSSPDLPNPHTFLPELMPPRPTASADTSLAGPSKKLGLCIRTTVYPTSYHDSFEPARRTAQTESSFSQHCILEAPWSAHIACIPEPRPSDSKPSKLIKRRVKKPVSSPSSLSSPCSQALRGVSRKPNIDTPLSSSAHKRQISLPQIRPPSPFKVDIPLHHSWHDRRTDFKLFSERPSDIVHLHQTNSRRTNGNTEILASLAWIGTPLMSPSPPTSDRWNQLASSMVSPDRFSMAIAVEDDNMSDDALVDRLEEVRRTGDPSEHAGDVLPLVFQNNTRTATAGNKNEHPPIPPSPLTPNKLVKSHDVPLPSPITRDATSDSEDVEVWQTVRKALLCIREIVRTEKRYQEAIKMLLNAQTATPPPPSMIPYISALVRVSETLLKCFLDDPSAWGVSTAFVASEDELEATMVSWCTVAGTFFMDANDSQTGGLMGRWRLRKSGVISGPSSSTAKQAPLSLNPQLPPPTFSMTSTISKTKEQVDEDYDAWRHPQAKQETRPTSVYLHKSESRTSRVLPPTRKLSVRDLAIQPIQRVMRYVLLYKDLLDCTPPPSRLLVERALEAANRIASHCDRAQRNPAFFHAS